MDINLAILLFTDIERLIVSIFNLSENIFSVSRCISHLSIFAWWQSKNLVVSIKLSRPAHLFKVRYWHSLLIVLLLIDPMTTFLRQIRSAFKRNPFRYYEHIFMLVILQYFILLFLNMLYERRIRSGFNSSITK